MIDIDSITLPTLIAALIGIVTFMTSAIIYLNKKQIETDDEEEIDIIMDNVNEEIINDIPKKNQRQRKNDQWKSKSKDVTIDHSWYISTLKGHVNDVVDIDFASDDKKFISISNDRSIILWDVRDFEEKEHKSIKQVIDFDTPTHVKFAPDCKSVVFSIKRENKLCVFKLAKKSEESSAGYHFVHIDAINFERKHETDISTIGIAGNGKYLMTSSVDNKVILYDLRGNVLKSIDPKVSSLYNCQISPDSKFVIVSGFTPDVFVYEPIFNREGTFQDAKKVFNLSGHHSGVFATCFNSNSTRAVTISKDGFWRIFDIEIRYNAGQDAKILRQGKWDRLHGATIDNVQLSISPSGNSFAISVGSTLKLFSSEDEEVIFDEIDNLHSSKITAIRFSPNGKYVTTCGDKYIRVLRNIPEIYSRIAKGKKDLPETTHEGARRRIKEQIEEDEALIKKYI